MVSKRCCAFLSLVLVGGCADGSLVTHTEPDAEPIRLIDADVPQPDAALHVHHPDAESHRPDAHVEAVPDAAVPDADLPVPGDGLEFVEWPSQQTLSDPSWGEALTDIANHLPASYGDDYWFEDDTITAAHETTHGINAHLRNYVYDGDDRYNVQGLYVLEDRAVFIVEPDILKRDIQPYVPPSLQGSRYQLYVLEQTAWDDMPTYIFDEWVAYTNGGVVGVQRVDEGLWTEDWQDGVAGQLEFVVYAFAVGMATEALDPEYFATNTQFRELIAWNARRAIDVFRKGRDMETFAYDVQDEYYETFRTSDEAADIRDFVERTYGEAFLRELLEL